MQIFSPRSARPVFWQRRLCFVCSALLIFFAWRAQPAAAPEARQSRETGPPVRLPRQQAQSSAAVDGVVRSALALPVAGAALTLRNDTSNAMVQVTANGEGIFRAFPLAP